MIRFNIENPLWLLLLIPAFLVAFITFFMVNKRFRYDATRIVSLILYLLGSIILVLVISGFTMGITKENKENEVLLLVDKSYSDKDSKESRDSFVRKAIDNKPANVKLGIVTFGYDLAYLLELTNDKTGAYDKYLKAQPLDDSATNLEKALDYSGNLFKNKKTAKIIIVSDLIETDGSALNKIQSLTLDGIAVDYYELEANGASNEILITDLQLPNRAIEINEEIEFTLKLESSVKTDAIIKIYDNDLEIKATSQAFMPGKNQFRFRHSFTDTGLHKLKAVIEPLNDTNLNNNSYTSFINLEKIENVLILERAKESSELVKILKDSKLSEVIDVKKIKDKGISLDTLRSYNQVILNNISNADMPAGFIDILHEYVYDYGGGVLTVAGSKLIDGVKKNNTYDKEDMEGTLYEEMLPVISERYTPPVGVMIVIDASGSMSNTVPGGKTRMDEAKYAAKRALSALDSRDYLGIISFTEAPKLILKPTAVAKKATIESKINTLESVMAGTVYSGALDLAGLELRALEGVNKKHIILISDGEPSASDGEYLNKTTANLAASVTTSCISFRDNVAVMDKIAKAGNGRFYSATNGKELERLLKEELASEEIREFEQREYKPAVGKSSQVFNNVNLELLPNLEGFYGTKLKSEATSYIVGEFGQPIYAAWAYGNGKVGSLMVDLNKEFSNKLIESNEGRKLILNIVKSVFPSKSIIKEDIDLHLTRENYSLKIDLTTALKENESLVLRVTLLGKATNEVILEKEITNLSLSNLAYLKEEGVYLVEAYKYNQDKTISRTIKYVPFSYSEEYNPFIDSAKHTEFIKNLDSIINGSRLDLNSDCYQGLNMSYYHEFDFKYLFISFTLICFLVDTFILKFKIKWPHEIYKSYKERKMK